MRHIIAGGLWQMTIQFANCSEYIELLTRLALTKNEARVFLALHITDNSTAKIVAKTSGVAREIVYQIIPKLENRGLVGEVIASPKIFNAIPVEDALTMLFEQRKKADKELYTKVKEISKKQQNVNNSQIEDSHIALILPKREDPPLKKEWLSFKDEVDFIMPMEKFIQWPQYYAESSIDSAISRKTKMRMITEKDVKNILTALPSKLFSPGFAEKLSYISYKFALSSPFVELVIFDKKRIFVSTQSEKQVKDMTWLYSTNPFIAELANSYFETLWSSSTDGLESSYKFCKHNMVVA